MLFRSGWKKQIIKNLKENSKIIGIGETGLDFYIQDAGRLIKKTKKYEDEIKSQIKESQKEMKFYYLTR